MRMKNFSSVMFALNMSSLNKLPLLQYNLFEKKKYYY